MAIPPYVAELRRCVGHRLLLLPGAAAVVRDAEGRVLVHRRADDGEVVPERLLGVFGGRRMRHCYPSGDEVEYVAVVFACRVAGGRLRAADGEATGFRWCTRTELAGLGLPFPDAVFDEAALRTPVFDPPA